MRIGIGQFESVEIPQPRAVDVWEFMPNRGVAIGDVSAVTEDAVRHPCDFPAIGEAIVTGDRIALAVDANCPAVGAVVLGILRALPMDDLERVDVVMSSEANETTVSQIRDAVSSYPKCYVERHLATDQEKLAYLAASASAEPIYLNRTIIEADFVVPVVTARPVGSLDPWALDGGVVPAFADSETQKRIRRETLEGAGADDRDASEAAWLLGIQFLVAVVPTAEAEVAGVFAGTPVGIRRAAEHQIEASWQCDTSRKADLVFACLDGDHQQQSWENVARALHVARHLLHPSGTIVITSRLKSPAGPALRKLSASEDSSRLEGQIMKDRHSDAIAAALLYQLRQEGRVLLLSDLPVDQVESLGIGAVENPSQLLRLVEGHQSCAIIRGAQFCGVGAPR